MSTSATITQSVFDAQAKGLNLLKQGSESAAKAIESWTEFLSNQTKAVMPEGIDLNAVAPIVSAIPSPTKAVESSFSFAEGIIAQQRDLTTKMIETVSEMASSFPGTTQSSTAAGSSKN